MSGKQKPQAVLNAEKAMQQIGQHDPQLRKALTAYAMQSQRNNADITIDYLAKLADQGLEYIKKLSKKKAQATDTMNYEAIVNALPQPIEEKEQDMDDEDHPYVNKSQIHVEEISEDILEIAKVYYTAVANGDAKTAIAQLDQFQATYPEIDILDQRNLGASTAYTDAGKNGHVKMMQALHQHPLIDDRLLGCFLEGAYENNRKEAEPLLDLIDISKIDNHHFGVRNHLANIFGKALEKEDWSFMSLLDDKQLSYPNHWLSDYAMENIERLEFVLGLDHLTSKGGDTVTPLAIYDSAIDRGRLDIMQHLEDKYGCDIADNDYRFLRNYRAHASGNAVAVLQKIFAEDAPPIPDDVQYEAFENILKRAFTDCQESSDAIAFMVEQISEQLNREKAKEIFEDNISEYDQNTQNYILRHIAPRFFEAEDWISYIDEGFNNGETRGYDLSAQHSIKLMEYVPHDQIPVEQWQSWFDTLIENTRSDESASIVKIINKLPDETRDALDREAIFKKLSKEKYLTEDKIINLYIGLSLDKDTVFNNLSRDGFEDADKIKSAVNYVEKWQQQHNMRPPGGSTHFNINLYKKKTFDGFCEIFQKEGIGKDAAEQYAYHSMAVFGTVDRGLEYLKRWGQKTKQPFHDVVSEMRAPVYEMNPSWDTDAWGDAIIKHGPKLAQFIGYARNLPQPMKSSDGKTWSYLNTKAKIAEHSFNRAAEHPQMAVLCLDNGISEEAFTEALDLFQAQEQTPVSTDAHIPNITVMGDQFDIPGYVFKKLPDGDYRGLFLGKYTDCCQYVSGHADKSVKYGFAEPDSGYYVIEDKKGQIISQSWAWRGTEGELVFDSLETLGATSGYREEKKSGRIGKKHWQKIFNILADKIEKEHQDISALHIGKGGRTPDFNYQATDSGAKINTDKSLYMDDSSEQYRVWQRNRPFS